MDNGYYITKPIVVKTETEEDIKNICQYSAIQSFLMFKEVV